MVHAMKFLLRIFIKFFRKLGVLTLWSFGGWIPFISSTDAGEPVELSCGPLNLALDPSFPRIIHYRTPEGTLSGQTTSTTRVHINGQSTLGVVSFAINSASSGTYHLAFPSANISCKLHLSLSPNSVHLNIDTLVESGNAILRTLSFPDNALLSIFENQGHPTLATVKATNTRDQYKAIFSERITPITQLKVTDRDTGNYLFLSADKLAAGIASNNFTDIQRIAWKMSMTPDQQMKCEVQNPVWEFREEDSDEPHLPWVKVFITADINDDNRADWQDAAIVYRRTMPKPFGYQWVKTNVGENIAINFASYAHQPFLKIFDEIKKIYLATDGLGNQIIIKGFTSEGHDSANSDYGDNWNLRAGGLPDLKLLTERAHQYNSRIGLHINATEVYSEAHRYNLDILQYINGKPRNGWSWLDQSHMIDKRKDVRSGQLFTALDAMRQALPQLDFLYVDTYWENGWPAAKTAQKINDLGLALYSEGDSCLDPWITWSHWINIPHTIQRFLWFSERDLFSFDPILRGGRVGTFMGWQGQHDFKNFVQGTFARQLPTKFLQHFELLRWDQGKEALFSNGVRVTRIDNTINVFQDGRPLMNWNDNGEKACLFIPWNPINAEKIYLWDEVGDERTWELPPSWKNKEFVYLYTLTDRGRGAKIRCSVDQGKITLKVPKSIPHVIYPQAAPAQEVMRFGEGSPLQNPGFDSYDLTGWTVNGNAQVDADKNGNPRLLIAPSETSVTVSQSPVGLEPSRVYAATVWALTSAGRRATLSVDYKKENYSNYTELCNVRHSAPNDPRTGTYYQRLRVLFKTPADSSIPINLSLITAPGSNSLPTEFDDVRIVETEVSTMATQHYFWEDFENVESGGYGPFTCCPGERTHLSEANPPYTKDTINGKFSLKSRDSGCVGRTIPATLRLEPRTRYSISCETLGAGHFEAYSQKKLILNLPFANQQNGLPARLSGNFITGDDKESYLALYRDGGDAIVVDDLAINPLGLATPAEFLAGILTPPPPPDFPLAQRKIFLEENFTSLHANWTLTPSKLPGTAIAVHNNALRIDAYANVSIFADYTLPAELNLVATEVVVSAEGDASMTWGPGLTLMWNTGEKVRLNLRPGANQFGVDSTATKQICGGKLSGSTATLRIRLEDTEVVAEARCPMDKNWQKVAVLPRAKFPGLPSKIRLGKTHGHEGTGDYSEIGIACSSSFSRFRLYSP